MLVNFDIDELILLKKVHQDLGTFGFVHQILILNQKIYKTNTAVPMLFLCKPSTQGYTNIDNHRSNVSQY